MNRPKIVDRIAAHGGLARVHVAPFTRDRKVVGWQNIYICVDGTRLGLSPAEEDRLIQHGDYLRSVRGVA